MRAGTGARFLRSMLLSKGNTMQSDTSTTSMQQKTKGDRPPMLTYLLDRANLVTGIGIICSGIAIGLIANGRSFEGVALALWAILADDIDGEIARRMRNRSSAMKAIGQSLDGFSDLVFGSVIPALIISALIAAPFWSSAMGAYLLLIGALRLSYFDHYGLSEDGQSTGLPVSYDLPLIGIVFLFHSLVVPLSLSLVLPAIFVPFGALHVASFKIKATGTLVHTITIFATVTISLALLLVSADWL
ncbi:CDP-alcohol phosphatidyltransferase [Sinorhizobium medicae]|nr:CDP-alcohol phosphatidyltransferase [Sinorhizobium medicae]MDX1176553.1 CDP-alcohol phosphatidyltransferase [Sinorhizobium medicae]